MITSHLLHGKRIAILGGGPTGLMTARLLEVAGFAATVYEREPHAEARLLGGTLDIHKGSGQRALARAGLLQAFYALAHPVPNRMANHLGQVVSELPPDAADPYERPEIDRPDFRNLLLASLRPDTVAWNCHVTGVEAAGTGFVLRLANGTTNLADLVLVADGANSRARRFVTDQPAQRTGTWFVQGEVYCPGSACPEAAALAGGGNAVAIHHCRTLFLHTKGNGHLSFYASFRLPGGPTTVSNLPNSADCAAVAAWLHALYTDWGAIYQQLFAASDEYRVLPLTVVPLGDPYPPHGAITLLGDAAHAMPPFGGQGANMGLVDALNLVDTLTSGQFATLPAAIAAYETKMRTYAAPVQQEALAADERVHTQTASFAERQARMEQAMAADRQRQWE